MQSGAAEAKKIRTIAIKPDGTVGEFGHTDTDARHRVCAANDANAGCVLATDGKRAASCNSGCGRGRAATRSGAIGTVPQRSAIA